MNTEELEQIAQIMVRYRLAEVTCEGLTVRKTMHEVERFQTERAPQAEPVMPTDGEPLDDEVLFHSSFAPRMTVEDLIAKQEKANGHG